MPPEDNNFAYRPDSSFQPPRVGSMVTTAGQAKTAKLLIFDAKAQACEEIDRSDAVLVIDVPVPVSLGKSGWCAVLSHSGNIGFVLYRYCLEVVDAPK